MLKEIRAGLADIRARFRDVPQIFGSITQIVFFVTPVIFLPLAQRGIAILKWNPFASLLKIVRNPILGTVQAVGRWLALQSWRSWDLRWSSRLRGATPPELFTGCEFAMPSVTLEDVDFADLQWQGTTAQIGDPVSDRWRRCRR
jgi:hypothetical protein